VNILGGKVAVTLKRQHGMRHATVGLNPGYYFRKRLMPQKGLRRAIDISCPVVDLFSIKCSSGLSSSRLHSRQSGGAAKWRYSTMSWKPSFPGRSPSGWRFICCVVNHGANAVLPAVASFTLSTLFECRHRSCPVVAVYPAVKIRTWSQQGQFHCSSYSCLDCELLIQWNLSGKWDRSRCWKIKWRWWS